MRAFDVLTKAEQDIRVASQPRYHFEMALLRWMHLRKLVPLTELMEQLGAAESRLRRAGSRRRLAQPRLRRRQRSQRRASAAVRPHKRPRRLRSDPPRRVARSAAPASRQAAPSADAVVSDVAGIPLSALKDRLLAEIRGAKTFFYNTVVAQAQRIEVTEDRVTFTFLPAHRALREQFEQTGPWLESMAERLAGRRMAVTAVAGRVRTVRRRSRTTPSAAPVADERARDAKTEAMSSPAVQAMLDVFPAQIRDVEEM